MPTADLKDFEVNPAPRPMLSRDADSMYWMARYVERAEHVARMLLINSNLLMDVGDLAPHVQQRQWKSVLDVMRIGEMPAGRDTIASRIQQFMTFNSQNPGSLLNCITRARENARAIRESISAE